jgi:hypothetical protein
MVCVCDIHAIVVRCGLKEEVCRHRDRSNLGKVGNCLWRTMFRSVWTSQAGHPRVVK